MFNDSIKYILYLSALVPSRVELDQKKASICEPFKSIIE